jgi:hypothetical protein
MQVYVRLMIDVYGNNLPYLGKSLATTKQYQQCDDFTVKQFGNAVLT